MKQQQQDNKSRTAKYRSTNHQFTSVPTVMYMLTDQYTAYYN